MLVIEEGDFHDLTMFEAKDLLGLSEPLKRLFEVTAEGIGGIARPTLTRKNAEAKAYEIKTISEAMAESQKLLGPSVYQDGTILIKSKPGEEAQLPEATPEERIAARTTYQEAKRQSNLENVVHEAAQNFDGTEEMGPERPDSDWTSRFFRIAEDITTEHMQALWGKVLAGEVKRPGAFSLRTLEVLKNISQKEAETFERIGHLAFYTGEKAVIPNNDNGKFLEDHFGIEFTDLLLLREIGLLAPNDLAFQVPPSKEGKRRIGYSSGETCVAISLPKGTPQITINSVVFTEIGKQLLQLIPPVPADPRYIAKLASLFQMPGVVVKSGPLDRWTGSRMHFKENLLVEVPGNKPPINPPEDRQRVSKEEH